MPFLLLFVALLLARPFLSTAGAQAPPAAALIARYRAALLRTMQANALPSDVDSLFVLLADSLVIEYPATRGRITGRWALLESIRATLGRSHNGKLVVQREIRTPVAVAAIEAVTFEGLAGSSARGRGRLLRVLRLERA